MRPICQRLAVITETVWHNAAIGHDAGSHRFLCPVRCQFGCVDFRAIGQVKMQIVIRGRRIMATFTLADRSTQVYPVLIGRATLNGKFIVDVQKGSPLREEEARRSESLQSDIKEEHI